MKYPSVLNLQSYKKNVVIDVKKNVTYEYSYKNTTYTTKKDDKSYKTTIL